SVLPNAYVCVRLVTLVFVVVPSPKSHSQLVIVPVELFVKLTVSGRSPLVGPPTKLATGIIAPAPVTPLVLLPPLLLRTTALLKLAALVGAKVTITCPVWPGPRLNGLPLPIPKESVVETEPVNGRPPLLTI